MELADISRHFVSLLLIQLLSFQRLPSRVTLVGAPIPRESLNSEIASVAVRDADKIPEAVPENQQMNGVPLPVIRIQSMRAC